MGDTISKAGYSSSFRNVPAIGQTEEECLCQASFSLEPTIAALFLGSGSFEARSLLSGEERCREGGARI